MYEEPIHMKLVIIGKLFVVSCRVILANVALVNPLSFDDKSSSFPA